MHSKHRSDVIEWNRILNPRTLLSVLAGTGLAVLAMKGFMIPNKFLDGGITGISILLHEIFHWNISVLVILFNLPFIYLGYLRIGKTFAVLTVIAVLLLALGLQFVHIEPVTSDRLLIAFFGGIIIGSGIGVVIRAGGVIDGAEVIAVFTKRRTGLSNTEIIMILNTFIFSCAALYLGLETAMYSIITYFAATKATEYVVDGIEEFTAMNIVSSKPEEVKYFLVNEMSKGITVYKGERGYLPGSYDIKTDTDIIVTVVTRLEIRQMRDAIMEIDPKAFIFVQRITEASGGVLKAKSAAH